MTYLLFALVYASVVARGLRDFYIENSPFLTLAAGLMLAYGLLLLSESWITRQIPWYPHLYLGLQTGLTFAVLIISPQLDYLALLFIPLCNQAMLFFPLRTGYLWVAVFAASTTVALLTLFAWQEALPFILIYAAVFVFVISYATATRQAEDAQQKSQDLLGALQEAHQQLQAYTAQAEEMAVLEERNRLARDLHDSVTQALYSLTLYAEAASRQLAAGDLTVTAEHLDELRQTAQQALREMRLLIFELRPLALEEEGLAAALRARLEAVEARAGLQTKLDVSGEARLPPEVEEGLYRIAQESLNNILKHAQAQHVDVYLSLEESGAILEIRDDGVGLAGMAVHGGGGLGLAGMRERAEKMGGQLQVSGQPGQGTSIRIEVQI